MENVYRQLLTEWVEKGAFRGGDSAYKKDLLNRTRAALSAAQPSVHVCPHCEFRTISKFDVCPRCLRPAS